MSNPFDRRGGRGSGRVVPLEKVKEIVSQRDRLADEVERLRERKQNLEEALESARGRLDELERRAEEAEARAGDLEAELENRDSSDADDLDERSALESKVRELRDDLERIRSRSDEVDEAARREERIRLLADLGTVLDSIQRGLSMQPDGPAKEGLEAIRSQVLDFFERHGATLVGEEGDVFDPEVHEAVDVTRDPQCDERTVTDVHRPGVVLEDGRLVLPARVAVRSPDSPSR